MNPHPISITNSDDGVRSRLTVFFRLLLVIPHVVWIELWGIAVGFAALASWFVTLFSGRTPDGLHNFIAAFMRYRTHVNAFVLLVANPFPGFVGEQASYPVDLHVAPAAPQNRWKTFFRIFLVFPALVFSSVLVYVLYAVAVGGWFVGMVTAQMPTGLQRIGVYTLRYSAQVEAYVLLLTDRYPYSGPESEYGGATTAALVVPTPPPAQFRGDSAE